MGFGELMGVKNIKLKLNGDYPDLESLYNAIKDVDFEAGKPEYVKYGLGYVIAFPEIDRNNQTWITGAKGKYTIMRSTQVANLGKTIGNMALDELTGGITGMSGAFGKKKKNCMEQVQSIADKINSLGL